MSERRDFDAVRLEYLKPSQLQDRVEAFPAMYVPFGPIEWHSFHLPFGTDGLKAHGVLCEAATMHGGVVYPPMYTHNAWDYDHFVPVLTRFFNRIKVRGFRVIYAISGHNVNEMTTMIRTALDTVCEDGTVAGHSGWENGECWKEHDIHCDHAAKWETSYMLHMHPEHVDVSALGKGEIKTDFSPPWGLSGDDPREHASAELGERATRLCADGIGKKAHQLLKSLPEEHRSFGGDGITTKFGAL